ncbi:hypothetical protein [Pseudomonas fragi]|uniref:hypothetical protein n=1 Tax=Pseudomonas fragi TaxID=296 RepID=UPI001595862C|nr:hypothetical protein [Pseudomonas fragi]
MTQDNEKPGEQPSTETTGNTGTPWHIRNPDGSVHGGNGIQPASRDTPADDSQDESLTE